MNKNKTTIAKNIIIDTLKGGFGIVLPTFGMLYIIQLVYGFIIALLSPITNFVSKFLSMPDWLSNIFSAFLVISICFICGFILKTRFGKFSYFLYEKVLKKLRIYKIFNTLQEIYNQFFGKKQKLFKESVLCFPFGREQVGYSGLISSRWSRDGVNYVSVFVPTCPNFSSGFLKHIREENVDVLNNVPVDMMMRTVIACGAGMDDLIELSSIDTHHGKSRNTI